MTTDTCAAPFTAVAWPLAPRPSDSRVYSDRRRVRLGDVNRDGRLRLDAIARYLQDIAFDDNHDSGLVGLNWVVRRAVIECGDLPSCTDMVDLATWVSGVGPRWAERRTTLHGPHGTQVEAAVLWVHLDPVSGTATPLPQPFLATFEVPAHRRRVRCRLLHDSPAAAAEPRPWVLRTTDFDALGHVNNAAYWEPIEDELARRGQSPARHTAELEFRAPIARDRPVTLLAAGDLDTWVTGTDGTVHASARLRAHDEGQLGALGVVADQTAPVRPGGID